METEQVAQPQPTNDVEKDSFSLTDTEHVDHLHIDNEIQKEHHHDAVSSALVFLTRTDTTNETESQKTIRCILPNTW
jgi:hypothetical protein